MHVGILGNEQVDELVNKGRREPEPDEPILFAHCKMEVSRSAARLWAEASLRRGDNSLSALTRKARKIFKKKALKIRLAPFPVSRSSVPRRFATFYLIAWLWRILWVRLGGESRSLGDPLGRDMVELGLTAMLVRFFLHRAKNTEQLGPNTAQWRQRPAQSRRGQGTTDLVREVGMFL